MNPQELIRLRLYVAGDSPRAQHAIRSLSRLDATTLAGRYALEVVDVLEQPERAETDHVLATPTLLRVSPAPTRRILGDLGDLERLLDALGAPQSDQPVD
jgi:circadian clock protein KaiB